MTSSRSYEFELIQDGTSLGLFPFTLHGALRELAAHRPARTSRPVTVRLSGPPRGTDLRVQLGGNLVAVLRSRETEAECQIGGLLREQCGEAQFQVGMSVPENRGRTTGLLVVLIPLIAPHDIERLYEKLVHDLEQAHLGLARDVLGRTVHRTDVFAPRMFDPFLEHQLLQERLEALTRALNLIGNQPSMMLTREKVLARWRAGDPVDCASITALTRRMDVVWKGGLPNRVDRMQIGKPHLTLDLPEHRQLRSGLERLIRRAGELRSGCLRASDLVQQEESRWGISGRDRPSVYEQRFLPQKQRLDKIASNAKELKDEFRKLLRRHTFISSAGAPRTQFAATPLFLNRRGYREAYEVLVQVHRERGPAVHGHELRIHFRSLERLYEYWTYITIVRSCWTLLGPSQSGTGFEVIHEVYRPELRPGQHFEWTKGKSRVRVYYEPEIPPAGSHTRGKLGWQAALVGAPLRPDVLVILEEPNRPPCAMVLDAKSTSRFSRERLFEVSDYRTLVYDPETGRQPIRHVFLVHRDSAASFCSLPGFLQGERDVPADGFLLGAVPLLPEITDDIAFLLSQFLKPFTAEAPLPGK